LIFWSDVNLQAQDFTPFNEDPQTEINLRNELNLITDTAGNPYYSEVVNVRVHDSEDHHLRLVFFMNASLQYWLICEWNYKDKCYSQLVETTEIGELENLKKIETKNGLNYLIQTYQANIDPVNLCHHLQIDSTEAIFQPMRFHSTREEEFLSISKPDDSNNSFIHISSSGIDFAEKISNNEKAFIKRTGELVYDTSERRMVLEEINEELSPPIEQQIPDTLFRYNSLIGKEKIRTYILQYVDMNGDEGNSQLCDLFKVIYLFRGQKFESELYTLTNPETEEKFDFSQFLPEYVQLTNGRVLLKTQNLYNAFRSGMCGACDFWDFSIYEVNKKSSQIVFNAAINLGMQSNSYEIFNKGNVIQSSHFRIGNDDAEMNINDVIWIRNKTWKIRFYEGEDSKEVYLKISPEKGLTGLANLNTSTKKKTKRV
jgi:hypothetical protein